METESMSIPISILLVEDDLFTRQALANLLRRSGYTVMEAGCLADAAPMVGLQDIALLDFTLPDGFGTEVLKQIRLQTKETSVAFVTASNQHELTGVHSADAYFKKPVKFDDLFAWIGNQPTQGRPGNSGFAPMRRAGQISSLIGQVRQLQNVLDDIVRGTPVHLVDLVEEAELAQETGQIFIDRLIFLQDAFGLLEQGWPSGQTPC